jgi:hypothetical protein
LTYSALIRMMPDGASHRKTISTAQLSLGRPSVHKLGQLSPDGSEYWDSQQWVPAISRDGNWRWNGGSWVRVATAEQTKASANVLTAAAVRREFVPGRGYKGDTASKLAVAIALLLLQVTMGLGAFELGVRSSGWKQQIARFADPPNPSPGQQPPQTHPSPSPGVVALRKPAPKPPASPPRPKPTAQPTCGAPHNPFGYDFCPPANLIYKPPSQFCQYFNCIQNFWISTNGYVVECVDNKYSGAGGHTYACLHHGGVRRALYS